MQQWRILLDLDGTVAQNAGRRLAARHFGLPQAEFAEGESLRALLGLTEEQFWAWWHEHQEAIYDLAEPLSGSAEGIRALKAAGAHIAVVTARRDTARSVTERWLERHGFPSDEMVFNADDKVAVARALGLNIGFEDDPLHAVPLADLIPMVLIDNFKNRQVVIDHPQVYRVAGWHEVQPLLRRLSAQSA